MIGALKDRLARSDRYLVGPLDVSWGALPRDLVDRRANLLSGGPLLEPGRSLFDPTLPADLRERLERRPWVKQVLRVKRRLPDTIQLELQLRTPVAVVCVSSERLAVDREGVVLERDSELGPPVYPEVRVLGEDIRRVPLEGRPFTRSAVQEALCVLNDIETASRHGHTAMEGFAIDEVVVGRADRRRRAGGADIQLRLDNGVVVAWGTRHDLAAGVVRADDREEDGPSRPSGAAPIPVCSASSTSTCARAIRSSRSRSRRRCARERAGVPSR